MSSQNQVMFIAICAVIAIFALVYLSLQTGITGEVVGTARHCYLIDPYTPNCALREVSPTPDIRGYEELTVVCGGSKFWMPSC